MILPFSSDLYGSQNLKGNRRRPCAGEGIVSVCMVLSISVHLTGFLSHIAEDEPIVGWTMVPEVLNRSAFMMMMLVFGNFGAIALQLLKLLRQSINIHPLLVLLSRPPEEGIFLSFAVRIKPYFWTW